MGTSSSSTENFIKDGELVALIKKGEYEHFPTLVKRYQPYIKSTALSLSSQKNEVEDLIQEGNIALYSAVLAFNSQKANFKTFAARCIKNAMVDVLRKQSAKHKIPSSLVTSFDDVEPLDDNTPEKIFFDNESYKRLTDSINLELSKLEHKVLSAHLSGMSYSNIADTFGISLKSVDNSLKRVREKLKGLSK